MRTLLCGLVLSGWLLAAGAAFLGPVASFESDEDQPFRPAGATLQRVRKYATDGTGSLEVAVPGSAADSWPGFILPTGGDWSARERLELDVFVTGDRPLQLSFRLDDTTGGKAFGSVPLRAGWNKGVGLDIRALGGEVDLRRVKQLLCYLRMPRQSALFYVDHVVWTTFAARFERIVCLDRAVPLGTTVDDRQKGFVVFQRPWLAPTLATSAADNRLTELNAFAAPGQPAVIGFCVQALHDLEQLSVSVSELHGPGTLPPTAWEPRVVENLDRRVDYRSRDFLADLPAYWAPLTAPLAVPTDRTRVFQLLVTPPADAAPGVYLGSVGIRADRASRSLPLRLRILPFRLPELSDLLYGEYYTKWKGFTDRKEQVLADLADMRRHGMTSVGLCFGPEASTFTIADGRVTFQFRGDTPFEWVLDGCRDLGFPAPLVLLDDAGQGAAASTGAGPGDPRYDQLYVAFHQTLAAEAQRRGWPRLIIQPVDEPGWQSAAERDRNVKLLTLLHAAGIPTEQDGPGDDYFHRQAGPVADVWNYNGGLGPAGTIAQAKAKGKRVTIYNNDVEGYRPEVDRWAYGLFNWCHGLDGGFNWAYRTGSRDLYNNLDAESGDWVHNFPPEPGRPGGPSTGWEGAREGVTDRRYLRLLESLLAKAPAGEAKSASEAFLTTLRSRLDARPQVRGLATWTTVQTAAEARALGYYLPSDAVKLVSGELKHPSGVALDEYDTIRWAVALQAWRLLAATGAASAPVARASEAGAEPRLEQVTRTPHAARTARPFVTVPVLAPTPRMDGQVEADPGWSEAGRLQLMRSDGAGLPQGATEVRFGMQQGWFFAAFVCHENRIDALTANCRETDGPVWQDDCVEVFLDPGLSGKSFYQVVVNPRGTVARIGPPGRTWKPKIQAVTSIDAGAKLWRVELAIPTRDLQLGPRFGLNFGRERRPTEVVELSTWAVTGGSFGRPERFGVGLLPGLLPDFAPSRPELRLAVSPSWQTTADRIARVSCELTLPEPATDAALNLRLEGPVTADLPVKVPRDETLTADLHLAGLPAGEYRLTARLTLGEQLVEQTVALTRVPGPFDLRP